MDWNAPKPLFYGIGVMVTGGSNRPPRPFDPWATFPFLKLPAEIRNKIYDLVVPICCVLVFGNHPQREIAEYKKRHQCRRAPKIRYRLRSEILSDTEPQNLAAAIAFLNVCRTFNREMMPLLYAKTTFRFITIKHIHKFLNIIPEGAKKEITSIELSNSAYGEPQWNRDEYWKRKSDWKWAVACARLEGELSGLRRLNLDIRVADWPVQLHSTADCFAPLGILKGQGLERVRIYLSHYRFTPIRCSAVARALEDKMMTPEGRELRDIEEAIEAVREMEEEAARKAQLPKRRAKKVLIIKDIPQSTKLKPPVGQDNSSLEKPTVKTRSIYRTKGLEGWARVDLDKVGVIWCGPPLVSLGVSDILGKRGHEG